LHRSDGGAALRSQTNQAFAEAQRAGLAAAERMRDREILGRATLVPTDDLVHRDTHAERLRLIDLSPGHHLLDDPPPPAARQDIGGWKEVTGAARRAHPDLQLLCTLGFRSRIRCPEPQRDRKYCRERQGNENEAAGPSCHSAGSLQRLEVAPHRSRRRRRTARSWRRACVRPTSSRRERGKPRISRSRSRPSSPSRGRRARPVPVFDLHQQSETGLSFDQRRNVRVLEPEKKSIRLDQPRGQAHEGLYK